MLVQANKYARSAKLIQIYFNSITICGICHVAYLCDKGEGAFPIH